MALPNYLAKIKSSGIYRFVWDKSEIPTQDTQTLRLVVGYSEKGRFNTPVYIESPEQFKKEFGDVSKKLERQGVFFHRNALQCLRKGPIYCLNLKKFNTKSGSEETVSYATFAASEQIEFTDDLKVVDIFDDNRFWNLEPEKLDKINNPEYITICATDDVKTSKTIVMRAFTPKQYNISFKNYFEQTLNSAELPEYLEGIKDRMMDEYFAEIYVFKGEWLHQFCTTPEMIRYFESDGILKKTVKDAFQNDVDCLDALANDPNSGFVNKYQGILFPDFVSPTSTKLSLDEVFNDNNQVHKMMMHFNSEMLYTPSSVDTLANPSGWLNCLSNNVVLKTGISSLSCNNCDVTSEYAKIENDYIKFFVEGAGYTGDNFSNNKNFASLELKDFLDNGGVDVENIYTLSTGQTLNIKMAIVSTKLTETQTLTLLTVEPGNEKSILNNICGFKKGDRFLMKVDSSNTIVTLSNIELEARELNTESIVYTYTFNQELPILQNLPTLPNIVDDLITPNTLENCLVKCNNAITSSNQEYTGSYFKGYEYQGGYNSNSNITKDNWIDGILDTLQSYPGIRKALTNNTDIEYHYLVDTFASFGTKLKIKNKLAMIAKEKDNCLALLNWPSLKSFKSTGLDIESVTNNQEWLCDAEYQSWVSYFTPVKMSTPYTGTKYECPSAALVSNCYMDKYESRYPYSIVAGPNFATLNDSYIIGPDTNYSREDLNMYEPYGINCLVYKPRKGTYVNSQQTAKQKPVTTLSKAHVREIVIYLQDEIEKILGDYHWEFNTSSLRETVKSKVDVICSIMYSNDALYDYFNVCDESNNTEDVINNEMFVVSTSIEPAGGAGKMVQELTLYRKGGMSSITK